MKKSTKYKVQSTKYKLLLLAVVFTPIIFFYKEIGFFIVFGVDNLFEPGPIKMRLLKEEKVSFELSVNKACGHDIGIQFVGKDYDHIKRIFGNPKNRNIPASLDIKIVDTKSGKIEFSKVGFGGVLKANWRGSNPIMFIAGRVYLKPGKYVVHINVNRVSEDVSVLETYFHAAHDPKITCEYSKQ